MSISFPTALDNFSNPTASSDLSNPSHSQQHSDLNDAVEALQLKVGITNSTDTNSLDYKIANVVGGGGSGTVTSVSVVTANGVSGSVATATTTPAITLTLGSITPSAVQVSGLTASQILSTDASKNLTSLPVATYPSLTELAFVKGVTSAIQTQINAKGSGTVTAVSVASANGISGSSSGGATPALTLALGAITPTTVNGVTISGSSTPTLAVTGTSTISGTNTGDSAGHTGLATLASPTFTGTVVVPTPFTIGAVSMTATGTELNYVSGVTSSIQTQLNAKEPLYTALTVIPPSSIGSSSGSTFAFNNATQGVVGQIFVPFRIVVNKITIRTGSSVSVAGTMDLTLYSEDGQTQLFSVTTPTISATNTLVTTSVNSVVVPAGNYYLMGNTNGTTNATIFVWNIGSSAPFQTTESLATDVASEPIMHGIVTITSGTPPATINPTTDIVESVACTIICRLDN